VSGELWDFTRRTIATLRWRGNVEFGSHNPFSSRGVQWSTDGEFWHPAPLNLQSRLEVRRHLEASTQMLSDVVRMVGNGSNEPLHHNLFREAWQQRHTNPRSALVIGLGAAELAVKYYIGVLVPDAEWLATNLPTPPLNKMLVEYLPKLKARCSFDGKVKPPPARILERLKEGVSIRNRVIHGGAPTPSTDKIEEILGAVRELLWLLDFYSGFDWALDFLSTETRSELSGKGTTNPGP